MFENSPVQVMLSTMTAFEYPDIGDGPVTTQLKAWLDPIRARW